MKSDAITQKNFWLVKEHIGNLKLCSFKQCISKVALLVVYALMQPITEGLFLEALPFCEHTLCDGRRGCKKVGMNKLNVSSRCVCLCTHSFENMR